MPTSRDIPIRVLVSPETADALDAYAAHNGTSRQWVAAALLAMAARALPRNAKSPPPFVTSRGGAA